MSGRHIFSGRHPVEPEVFVVIQTVLREALFEGLSFTQFRTALAAQLPRDGANGDGDEA